MAENKDFTPQEYESIIEELRKENEALKKKIAELENKEYEIKAQEEPVTETSTTLIEAPATIIGTEIEEPVILVEEPIKKDEIHPIQQQKEVITSESILSPEVRPLEMGKGEIVLGVSRRECPRCGNTNKALIRETIDRTHLISDYPRMYGKKYHCGNCGVEWRVPLNI